MSQSRSCALLLTDVVDSTRLGVALGDARMARLWAAHDRLARDLLPRWRGREIDKTDGMLLLFDSADDAVGFALAYQAALQTLQPPLAARAGLHVGTVLLRENLPADVALGAKPIEVEGAAKATAARIMSVARGGQLLLSAPASQALTQPELQRLSHGHWQLKGLDEPLELFEVNRPGTAFAPPPDADKAWRVVRSGALWLPARNIRHSLPAERDEFVGRGRELLELAAWLRDGARLVSVLGVGGTGKTRLATRFGWQWLGDFPGGVWFCDLAQARDLDGVVQAVAQGLEVPLAHGDPVLQLGHAIAGHGAALVILDNFEQVARLAAPTLGRWLDRAAGARFLVTTREVLGLPGERVQALAPLPSAEAALLFHRRAEAARPGVVWSGADAAAIAPLMQLLDGLPLAVELAAARVPVMSPQMLLQRMSERFKLLTTGGGRIDRQATLRAVFDWSWELLRAAEKSALAQLSVFAGGWTLPAAEAVIDLQPFDDALATVDVLQSLLHKSFVQQRDGQRFDLLVSVQDYAAEHLRTPGRFPGSGAAAMHAAQARHGRYFAGADMAPRDGCSELENLSIACRRSIASGDGRLAVQLLEGAWLGLRLRGPFQSAVDLATHLLALPGLDITTTARAHAVAGSALQHCGFDDRAYAHFESARALSRDGADPAGEARALQTLGDLDIRKGLEESARGRFDAAMRMALQLNDATLLSDLHNSLGNLAEQLGRIDEAREHYEAAAEHARAAGDRQREAGVLGNLALLNTDRGQMHDALALYRAALAAARQAHSLRLEGNTLCNLGLLLQLLGDIDAARAHLEQSLAISRGLGNAHLECNVLCNLGIVFESLGQPAEALGHYEAALALARTLGDGSAEGQFLGFLGLLHARQSRHAAARECLDAGQALLQAALNRAGLGVLLCNRAEAALLAQDRPAADELLRAAALIAAEIGAGAQSELGLALARVRQLAGATPA